MKITLLTSLLLLFTTIVKAQVVTSSNDRALLRGSWGIHEMKKDGELAMSLDPKEQQIIIDNAWAKDSVMLLEMGMSKDILAESMKEQSENLARVTFVFSENGNVTVSANDGKSEDVLSPYTMNEEKKEIIIQEENEDQLKYTYSITTDQLILKQEQEGDELIFKRKS